ncbi:polymer-forming cytoskeletal protein [Clostridium estertheticum]|uniref:polymer-forming cytoskeletal protein n=1 Tax=Clostridium estertheticum TaxID=238834 RepID=UPI001CF4ACEB|nr:polymer-forming cytoskeletal protein [Clostridium estertheticum]MCB2305775.1 polymer-forming cytoskeletal protein [Clostridium estertheticum]MCB2347048.1 polymer-forming cytoskeletal protein [Clostridium estertheticum]MCB2348130.1 polymer-forming cytoskeletal protein [Clostridium estertheticum]WAG45769.1 polymer-forming cytoskeletal protein [Clostridium estertheticum]
MENMNNDLKMSGSGSSCGGKYNDVFISGSVKINGDLDCVYFKTSGSSKVIGNLKAETIKISGSSKIEGNVEVKDIKISGSTHVIGNLKSENVSISGSTHIDGNLYVQDVNISGSVTIGKNCEAECFKANGGFKIQELLNAGQITIRLGGNCFVKEIGGEHIDIRVNPMNNSIFRKAIDKIFNTKAELTTDIIEGDDIYLQNTNVNIVRGNNITIGTGCNIGLIEYKDEINISDSSIVKDQKKI